MHSMKLCVASWASIYPEFWGLSLDNIIYKWRVVAALWWGISLSFLCFWVLVDLSCIVLLPLVGRCVFGVFLLLPLISIILLYCKVLINRSYHFTKKKVYSICNFQMQASVKMSDHLWMSEIFHWVPYTLDSNIWVHVLCCFPIFMVWEQ